MTKHRKEKLSRQFGDKIQKDEHTINMTCMICDLHIDQSIRNGRGK